MAPLSSIGSALRGWGNSGLYRSSLTSLGLCIRISLRRCTANPCGVAATYLMPTPPAMKMARLIFFMSRHGGGHTKLPPTRTLTSPPMISSAGFHNHAAGGLSGLFCTANSKYGLCSGSARGSASEGEEVMEKPPAFSTSGTKTSSHWPGRN